MRFLRSLKAFVAMFLTFNDELRADANELVQRSWLDWTKERCLNCRLQATDTLSQKLADGAFERGLSADA